MVTSTPVPTFLVPFFLLSATMTSMIKNSSWSSSPSWNGISMSKEHLTRSPLSPTTKTCPTSRTPTNCPTGRHAGPSFCRTLTLSVKSFLVLNLPLLMPYPTKTRWTPPSAMLTSLLSLYLRLLMPLISPSPITSSPSSRLILLYFVLSKTCPMTLPSSHIPLLMTGPLIMDICTTRGVCMFRLPLAPLCYILSIHPPSRVTLDDSALRLSWSATSGGLAFPSLSTTLSLDALFSSRTRPVLILLPCCFYSSNLPLCFPSNNSLLTSSPTFPFLTVITSSWSW